MAAIKCVVQQVMKMTLQSIQGNGQGSWHATSPTYL